MSNGTLGNPACEGEQLIIQVMGKEHPAGHEIVIVDQYRGEQLAEFGEAEMEDLPEPTSVLHKWCWQGYQRVNAQLHIESESGEPIRLPLLEWLYKNKRKLRMQDNVIQPVLPMALWQGLGRHERHALPLRPGYLYIFYGDKLWREIQASANAESGRLEFRDIDLAAHRDDRDRYQDDRRPTAGIALEEIWLPRRANERYIDGGIRIAYSEVQWSAARINYLQADTQAQRTRCHAINLSSANNFASLGQLYILSNEEPQRLREPFAEQQVAQPERVTRDLSGQHLVQLYAKAREEQESFEADGTVARAAADQGMQVPGSEETESLYAQAGVRAQVLSELVAVMEQRPAPSADLWQRGLDAAEDSLADAQARHIPGLILEDLLFDMRHALSGCQASERYLLEIPRRAARDPRYQCAFLVNQTVLKPDNGAGEPNALHRHADQADLDATGDLAFVLCQAQREVARHQHQHHQARLAMLLEDARGQAVLADLFSLEGHDYLGAFSLAGDLLAALGKPAARLDRLNTEPPDRPAHAQQLLLRILREDSSVSLHAMLFPSEEASPLDAPLALPEGEEENPGDGRLRLKAVAGLGDFEPPTDEDDLQIVDTSQLTALNASLPMVPELKRWAGAVDLTFGKIAEQAGLMMDGLGSQGLEVAVAPPVIRLARAGLPDLLVGSYFVPPAEAHGKVILGVFDEADGLIHGLTPADRNQISGDLAKYRRHLESTVRDISGRTFSADNVQRLTDAAGNQGLRLLVADPDSVAAEVARKARRQYSLSRTAEAVRLPYVIAVLEFINLRMEWAKLRHEVSISGREAAALINAAIDISAAMAKALDFFGERHNRLVKLRANVVSRQVPWGNLIARIAPNLAQRLPAVLAASTILAASGGALSAAIFGWDSYTNIRNGNLAAGVALAVASASGLVVAGSALMVGIGPVGWVALAVMLAAVALAFWLADDDLRSWLRMGPFGTHGHRAPWLQDPDEAYDRLVSLLAGIRIRIDPIAPTTAEAVAAQSLSAIGLLPGSATRPMPHIEWLQGDSEARDMAHSIEHYRSMANTRIVVESNLAALAPGWEKVVRIRRRARIERWSTSQFLPGWLPDGQELAGYDTPPLFERATVHGMEYYVNTPEPQVINNLLGRPKQRTSYSWTVRVQWRQDGNAPMLPRALPAPSPTRDPARIDAADRHTPDFERTNQPYWASEHSHPDDQRD